MVTFNKLKVVAIIVYYIYDKAIQLKGKQVMNHVYVLSLIKGLQPTI